ncbi:MAG: hypothetical protein HRF46_12590 [Acidobacteriota bacterium]|jgi:hypothetical protein
MPFEKFIPARKQKPPQASIKRTGTISLDAGFASQVGLAEARAVTLYFDPQKRLVGLRAADPKEDGAVRLSHRTRVASVRARPLFQAYGIALEETARVPVSWDEAENLVVLPLPAGGRRPRGRPRKGA